MVRDVPYEIPHSVSSSIWPFEITTNFMCFVEPIALWKGPSLLRGPSANCRDKSCMCLDLSAREDLIIQLTDEHTSTQTRARAELLESLQMAFAIHDHQNTNPQNTPNQSIYETNDKITVNQGLE